MSLLTVPEAAKELRVSRYTLYRLINDRKIPVVRVSERSTRISRKDLEKFIDNRRTQ